MKQSTKKFLTSMFAFVLVITGAICLTACGDKKNSEPEPVAITLTIVADNQVNQYDTFTGKYASTVLSENNVDIDDDNSIGFYLDQNFTTPFINSALTKNTILYTKMATLDKITIQNGIVSAKDTTIEEEVVLPRSAKEIYLNNFNDCTLMTSILFPSSISSYPIFKNCTALKHITVVGDNTYFCSENDVLFNKAKTQLLSYPKARVLSSYTVPESVKEIGEYAFVDCKNLEIINLLEGCNKITNYAFMGCINLQELSFPSTIRSFGNGCFQGCSSLTYVRIPENVALGIGTGMFNGCTSLTAIYIDSADIAEYMDSFYYKASLNENNVIIYIKSDLNVVSDSSDSNSFISNFTKQSTSDKEGYDMYIKNS